MLNSIIKINNINVDNNSIKIEIDASGKVKRFLKEKIMYIEYNKEIKNLPKGIAVIPLLTNILPIAWFSDSEIIVEELDKTFYEAIDKIKIGYKNMHLGADFNGKITVKKIVNYKYEPLDKSATFFSGGVDSLATLINRLDEKPALITVWGSDIKVGNTEGWDKVKREVVNFGTDRGLDNWLIKSNFREVVNEIELDKAYQSKMNDGWWHGAQHGIGLIGLAIPLAYVNKLKTLYIPSTFTEKDGHVSCASYPTIDNNVAFAGGKVLHEGFENTRQNKINIISRYIKEKEENLFIRVCWQSTDGKNCSECEKCSRTIMGLISQKINPNNHGFTITQNTLNYIENNWKNKWILPNRSIRAWIDIKNEFLKNKDKWQKDKNINWILDFDFEKENNKKLLFTNRVKRKILRVLRG